jgi:hypothetical protein
MMYLIMFFSWCGYTLVLAVISFFVFKISQSLYYYVKFSREKRIESVDTLKKISGKHPRFYLISSLLFFNGVLYPCKPDEANPLPPTLIAKGIMIKRLRVTKKFLRQHFVTSEIRQLSLSYFS